MIDVIIPAYNAINTIRNTLDSIVNQSIKDQVKVYIVDDCSENNYDEIVNEYVDSLDINLFRLDKNMGPGYARQYGINHSYSKYIVFIDSDDMFFSPNSLEAMLTTAETYNLDSVSTFMTEDNFGEYNYFHVAYDTLHAKIYKRSFLKEHNIVFPYNYNSEDIAFNALVVINTTNLAQIDENTYIYKRRKNSLTQTDDYFEKKHIKCYSDNIKFVVKHSRENNYDKTMVANCLESQFSYFYHYFKDKWESDQNIECILDLIDDYDEFHKYFDPSVGTYWLHFWTEKRNNEYDYNDFLAFLDFCREKQRERKKN